MTHPARDALTLPADGHFVMIPLTHGKFAIVDEADAEPVLRYGGWHAVKSRSTYYTFRTGDASLPATSIHNLITGHKRVDHVNHNGLDNRRINLRPATPSQNAANCGPPSTNKSGYKGVCWNRSDKKWAAHITVSGKRRNLGRFADPIEAARAYNRAAAEAWGEYAWLNPV